MWAARARVPLVLAALIAGSQSACRGCDPPKSQRPPPPAVDEAPPVPSPPPRPASATDSANAPTPSTAATSPQLGPTSRDGDGFHISTGFLDRRLQPLPQPRAQAETQVLVTGMDAEGHTLGQLTPWAGHQMHAFLIARDLRHVLYASADKPIRENADARALPFTPPGGGDHALVAVFWPQGGQLRAVSAPVTVSGNLPTLAGPGVRGLKALHSTPEAIELNTEPAIPVAGQPVHLRVVAVARPAPAQWPPFLVVLDEAMASAQILERQTQSGDFLWPRAEPGHWLVVLPPETGTLAPAFGLKVSTGNAPK